MQHLYIAHRQNAILLSEAFCKIGGTGKARIKSDLRNIIMLLLHHFPGSFQPVFF